VSDATPVVCQPCIGELKAVLEEDCEVCEDVLALTYDDGCYRIQCKSGCPPYAEGVTILDVVKDWTTRDDDPFVEGPAPAGIIIVDDLAADCPPVTPEQRAKIRDTFGDWMATAAPDGTFTVIESRPPWWHLPRWIGLWWRKWKWRRGRRRAANKRRRDR
jgi:hypothetical protein